MAPTPPCQPAPCLTPLCLPSETTTTILASSPPQNPITTSSTYYSIFANFKRRPTPLSK